MAKITIDKKRCKGCLLCISFCPKGLIRIDKNLNQQGIRPVKFFRLPQQQDSPKAGKSGIPSRKTGESSPGCLGCSMCAIICPECCIEVYK